ncbi:MAG: 4Fe-4S binding protein [Candidatus Firestonebacteria bacterium]
MKHPVINKDLCTGCGVCVDTCGHKVLELVDGVAKLTKPEECDGAGICAGVCPLEAIEMKE